ncbi:Right handed beta helix region [Polaribacter sp. KT25b]|uniref:PDZ domain-containing protein n=1 Tax=Polaribacter sp. KT25b TaxID=1855336 RepID=UPI00087AFCFA|nr:right-handed parallel beta-helix repeat-containing protein [Polaribacter sp. KT25b]SDS23138.1 Right handed beta helix region [Polaribacter sp. KT25b]
MKKIITLLLVLCIVPLYALDIHVATNGSDANDGTASKPLLTIKAAQAKLRASGLLGKEACNIVIHEGVYRLITPLQITTADSGSEQFPVVYSAAKNENVVITGAQLITSKWEEFKDGIYRTHVGDLNAIDQLFVDQKRQHMARYPNFNAGFIPTDGDPSVRGKKAGTVPFSGAAPDAWDAKKAAEWKDPTGAILNGMHRGLWGSQHYFVTGKNNKGELVYEGGWQNNRSAPPHKGYRMIENVFEELDVPGEWYHNTKDGWLYYMPEANTNLNNTKIEAVLQIKHLIEVYGDHKLPVAEMVIRKSGNAQKETIVKNYETTNPVKHIQISGIHFTGTKRTLRETIEPLLRSDWCVYRGGAIHMRGTENIVIDHCSFKELGGNAVFVDSYSRNVQIKENIFQNNGSTDVNFVGSFAAVRDPSFSFQHLPPPLDEIDTTIGPKAEDYPADCIVENNLMMLCGRFEKQASGINISMSSRITLRHNTISHTPRAAINICDGTWGGHIIEWNDCFETVLETHDHGAFNSWGRDRYWFRAGPSGPDFRDENGKAMISYYIEKYPNAPLWDAYQTTIIRNNRMQCDHGWDIDLDDGSTNYEIYNNISLSGGIKTREGYHRTVTNNVILGRGYTCNVPYPKPTNDIFERNILWGGTVYKSSNPTLWGGTRNFNFVHNPDSKNVVPAYGAQEQTQDDAESLYGNVLFAGKPQHGDFTVSNKSAALSLGFKNFPMSGFGVTSDKLKNLAMKPKILAPKEIASNVFVKSKLKGFMGAKFKTLETEAELSATGMFDTYGVLLVSVPKNSKLAKMGFKVDDVVIELNSEKIADEKSFVRTMSRLNAKEHNVKVWRHQKPVAFSFTK